MTAAPPLAPAVAVVDAAGAAAADRRAIDGGIPSRALMQRAGAAAAALLAEQFADRLAEGVLVATGPGNNGGDGWVVAHALHAAGIRVRVVEVAAARTPDARAERAAALAAGVPVTGDTDELLRGGERVAVDAVLGTGFTADGPMRLSVIAGPALLAVRRERGSTIVAIDIPSGMDASDGIHVGACRADLTITFGTIKRAHLAAREHCGRVVVVDIGLGAHGALPGDARLASPGWFRAKLPPIAADAHKGTRGKVVIIGGGPDMAGAAILAARGALRSGAGMVKCLVSPASQRAVQEAEPAALCGTWPREERAMREVVGEWADVVLIGPGLGRGGAREMVELLLSEYRGPVVLDADALNAFTGAAGALASLLAGRPALLTPHKVEFARLADIEHREDVADGRFTLPAELARRTGAAVLLKGQPTVVASPAGDVTCVAEGTPVLATGGSGDVLAGMAAALLAQLPDPALAGALAAYAHGRAAQAVSARQVRGYTLDDVLAALPGAWAPPVALARPPVLADLPPVGEPA